jgi:hypothetical protein
VERHVSRRADADRGVTAATAETTVLLLLAAQPGSPADLRERAAAIGARLLWGSVGKVVARLVARGDACHAPRQQPARPHVGRHRTPLRLTAAGRRRAARRLDVLTRLVGGSPHWVG